jgi:glutaminase
MHDKAEAALDVYFKQCSILVTCRDLAAMAATLSNMGRHPVTGRSAYVPTHVKDMLSIMFTCGMYDYSGQWAYRVGVPAKSGVSGGVITVSTASSESVRTHRAWIRTETVAAAPRCAWTSLRVSACMCSIA